MGRIPARLASLVAQGHTGVPQSPYDTAPICGTFPHSAATLYGCGRGVAAGGCGRCLTAPFAWGSSITNTGLGANTGEGAVVKPPSDIVE
jgi:hypothetical protein